MQWMHLVGKNLKWNGYLWWCKSTQVGWKSTQFEYCTHIGFTIKQRYTIWTTILDGQKRIFINPNNYINAPCTHKMSHPDLGWTSLLIPSLILTQTNYKEYNLIFIISIILVELISQQIILRYFVNSYLEICITL